jgi:toxin FitB
LAWLRAHEPDIAVDPVILGKLRFGILILPKGRKRTALERWFDAGVVRLHCLPWDADTGLKWAELVARLRTTGKAMPIKDSLIAATAAVYGLAVATRNRSDFVNAGVRIVVRWLNRRVGAATRNKTSGPEPSLLSHGLDVDAVDARADAA